jgi:hypothetical protein
MVLPEALLARMRAEMEAARGANSDEADEIDEIGDPSGIDEIGDPSGIDEIGDPSGIDEIGDPSAIDDPGTSTPLAALRPGVNGLIGVHVLDITPGHRPQCRLAAIFAALG